VERNLLVSIATGGPERSERGTDGNLVPVPHRMHRGRCRVNGVEYFHAGRELRKLSHVCTLLIVLDHSATSAETALTLLVLP
jgi:hypothetical protein